MTKMTLMDVIKEACGVDDDIEAAAIARDAGYIEDVLDQQAILIGTCWDGNNRAQVWALELGGYHTSAQAGEIYDERLPDGFEEGE